MQGIHQVTENEREEIYIDPLRGFKEAGGVSAYAAAIREAKEESMCVIDLTGIDPVFLSDAQFVDGIYQIPVSFDADVNMGEELLNYMFSHNVPFGKDAHGAWKDGYGESFHLFQRAMKAMWTKS